MTHERFVLPKELYHTYIVAGDPVTDPLVIRDELQKREEMSRDGGDFLFQIYEL